MTDWDDINRRIRLAIAEADPESGLRRLLDETRDGWVAFRLGQLVARRSPEEAIPILEEAYRLLPLPRYREDVRKLIAGLKGGMNNVPAPEQEQGAPPPATGSGSPFSLDLVWPGFRDRFKAMIVASREEPGRPASTDDRLRTDNRVRASLRDAVYGRMLGNGGELWSHQFAAIDEALNQRDVVLQTATASGKSLAYWVPVISRLVENPAATAIYVSPLNALVDDQLRVLRQFFGDERPEGAIPDRERFWTEGTFDGVRILATRFDGTIDAVDRPLIRERRPRIIVTNPEMLHMSLLAHHRRAWPWLMPNLAYLVLDEMHTYRGLFGANMANVLRRLQRLCVTQGAAHQIFGCSATIANAEELFELLTGRSRPTLIDGSRSGAPVYPRRIVLLDSLRTKSRPPKIAADIISFLVRAADPKTISFMRSISEVDEVKQLVDALLPEMPRDAVLQYKRQLPTEEKARVLRLLRDGTTRAVVATNALELGIDVGQLSACLICKFPGRKASLMQQIGRAGRGGESIAVILADDSAVDQFFVTRPDLVFLAAPERVFLNPSHAQVLRAHLVCAANELPLDSARDAAFFGPDVGVYAQELEAKGELVQGAGGRRPADPRNVVFKVAMRGTNSDCPVYDGDSPHGVVVARPDFARARRFFHRRARFRVQDRVYEVHRLQIDSGGRTGSAYAHVVNEPYPVAWTESREERQIRPIGELDRAAGRGPFRQGAVEVTSTVSAMALVRPVGLERLEKRWEPLGEDAPPPLTFGTDGMWFDVQPRWLSGLDPDDRQPALRSACEALRTGAALACSTEREDLVSVVSALDQGALWRISLADSTPGGDGLTRAAFDAVGEVVECALRVLRDCPDCSKRKGSRGCPACVVLSWAGPRAVHRDGGMQVLESLRHEILVTA